MKESIKNMDNSEKPSNGVKVKIPKNIRQMGELEGNKKIYVEDYVMTYTKQLAQKSDGNYQSAVLLGYIAWQNNCKHIFISGAVAIKDYNYENGTAFSNDVWSKIYDDIKVYFDEIEIVGWLYTKPGLEFVIDDKIRKIHLDNFSGQDKTLLLYDSVEKEEAFYLFSGNSLRKQKGYYIYYEKNEAMQNYMLEDNKEKETDAQFDDTVVKNMRAIISKKKSENSTKHLWHIVYGVGTVAAAAALIIGTAMLNNSNDKMSNMESAITSISKNITSQTNESKTEVETVNSHIGDATEVASTPEISTAPTPSVTPTPSIVPTPTITAIPTKDPVVQPTIAPTMASTPVPTTTEQTQVTQVAPNDFYIVNKGDTLSEIAERLFNSIQYVDRIKQLNQLNSEDQIEEGQRLLIPSKE